MTEREWGKGEECKRERRKGKKKGDRKGRKGDAWGRIEREEGRGRVRRKGYQR